MASNPVIAGPTAKRVAENVLAWRKARQLQQKDLSAKLGEIGRPMLPTVISKVERGERRIDVDDLVALAVALDVSPLVLLLPRTGDGQAAVLLTEGVEASAAAAWEWADGDKPLTRSENDPYGHALRFRLDSRPEWDRDPLRARYNDVLSDATQRSAIVDQSADWQKEDGQWVLRTSNGVEVWRGPKE